MLKKYEERQLEELPQTSSFVVIEEEESEKLSPTFKLHDSCGFDSVTIGYGIEEIQHAEMTEPLTEMTKNKTTLNREREEAFEPSKKALSSGPIVKAPDLEKAFVLRSDASDSCIGAILMQDHDGFLNPVSYASRQLQPREKRYSAIERECLAFVWAIEKFHVFIYGTSFVVQTDHQPLQYILKAKHLNSRVLPWSLALQEYSFRVEHIKGSENVAADYESAMKMSFCNSCLVIT